MAIPSTVTPFADEDEQDEDSLYSVAPSNAAPSDGGRFGPDGDGSASSDTGSQMPQYSPQQSGATSKDNTSAALSGGKASGVDPLAGSLYEKPPDLPSMKPIDRTQRDADQATLNTDSAALDQSKYKPSIGRRIAGALAGISDSFAKRPQGSEEDILNEPYANAQKQQQAKETADQTRLKGDQQGITDQQDDEAQQARMYGMSVSRYEADQGQKGAQWNRTHDLSRDATADQHWGTEDTERQNRDQFERTHSTAEWGEQVRHNRAEEANQSANSGYEGRRVAVDERRLTDEEATGTPGSPTNKRLVAQDAAKAQSGRQSAFDKINHGDPKGEGPFGVEGYQGRLKTLQGPTDPETGEPWKSPDDQNKAVASLQQQHLDELNRIETDYVDNMHGLGFQDVKPVHFNDLGEADTNSSGQPIQRQKVGGGTVAPPGGPSPQPGGAPPQGAPQGGPQGAPQPGGQPGGPQAAAPAKPSPAQPAQPQVIKTRTGKHLTVGQSVTVGGKSYRVKGFNQQSGKAILGQ